MYSLSDVSILTELGNRLKSLRLQANMTQKELAEATAVSLNVIKALETGKGKLSTLVAVLRELHALEQLHRFILEPSISPLQLAKQQGRQRQRASGERVQNKKKDEVKW